MALKDVLVTVDQIGLTSVILPFILVFTVVFATLQKTRVLGVTSKGKPKSNYNAMVAFVLAFFVLIMARTLNIITLFTRSVVVLLIAFVFLGIIFSFLGVREHHKGALMFAAMMLLVFVLLEALTVAGAVDEDVMNRLFLPVLAVIFLVGTAYFMLSKPKKTKVEEEAAPAPRQEARPAPAQEPQGLPGFTEEESEELGKKVQEILKKRQQHAAPRAR